MRLLEDLIGHPKELVFLDLEGTQIEHETIAIGACAYFCDEHLLPVKNKPLKIYKEFVKTNANVGNIVEKLTGITNETLRDKGIPFNKAIAGVVEFSKCEAKRKVYITFGNQDLTMMKVSANKDKSGISNQFYEHISRHWFDLQEFISTYVYDTKHKTYSLKKLVEIFKVEDLKHNHDPLYDAENLKNLFIKLIQSPEILVEWFLKNIKTCSETGKIIELFIKDQLLTKETVSSKDFRNYLLEYFK